MAKYFMARPIKRPGPVPGRGPNYSCTTSPITPLTDVTTEEGLATINDRDRHDGGQRQYQRAGRHGVGLAHRVERRAVHRRDVPNRKRATTRSSSCSPTAPTPIPIPNNDPAGNKSTYAAYGYTGQGYNGTGTTRLFMGTSGAVGQYNYTSGNYTDALNEQMTTLCANAKAANVLLMTVSLDLSTDDTR